MPRAEVYLEDVEAPAAGANVRFVFSEGFNPESPAHQLANILRFKLDEMAKSGELQALDEPTSEGDLALANEELAKISK